MKKLNYVLKRISLMGLPEISYRGKWKLRQEFYYRFISPKKNMDYSKNDLYEDNFFFEKYNKEDFLEVFEENFDKNEVIKIADSYCDHNIPIFEINKNLGEKIIWNRDYKSGKLWPRKFIGSIHHEESRYGDTRYVWELNRFSFLPVIAKAYFLTGKDKYAKEVLFQIESWIEQNPYLKTVNWFSGLEIGVRMINWVWTLKLIKGYPKLDEHLDVIMDSVYNQTDFVYNNLSKFSSANNHLVGELAGLKIVSFVFPGFTDSKKWSRVSSELLKSELNKQIYSDGVGAEQSINYLIFILELGLGSFLVKGKMPSILMERLEKSCYFLDKLMDDGKIPSIGDSDDAHFIHLSYDKRVKTLFNLGCVLLKDPYLKNTTKNFDEASFWILGPKALKVYEGMEEKEQKKNSELFKEGGYFVSKNNNSTLIFDCGRLGYLQTAGHGHCDSLSFILSLKGNQIFVDPGTFSYHGNRRYRDYFRSTGAHNTLRIDDAEQSEIKGNFMYGRKANTCVRKVETGDVDKIVAYHDGYKNVGVTHERELIHNKKEKTIKIIDNIKTDSKHNASLFFNLHPDVKVAKTGNNIHLRSGDQSVILKLDKNLNINIFKGGKNPIKGWYSPSFGIKVPTTTIEASIDIDKPIKIETLISY